MSPLVLLTSECGRTDPFVPCASCITCIDLFSPLPMFSCRVFRQQGEVGGRPNPPREQWPALAAVSLISRLHSLCIFCPTQPHCPQGSGKRNGKQFSRAFSSWDERDIFASERKICASWFYHRSSWAPSTLLKGTHPATATRQNYHTTISSLRWKKNFEKDCTDTPLSPPDLWGLALAGQSSGSQRCFLPLMSPGASQLAAWLGRKQR